MLGRALCLGSALGADALMRLANKPTSDSSLHSSEKAGNIEDYAGEYRKSCVFRLSCILDVLEISSLIMSFVGGQAGGCHLERWLDSLAKRVVVGQHFKKSGYGDDSTSSVSTVECEGDRHEGRKLKVFGVT